MIKNLLILGVVAAIGYFVWTYVENGFNQMDAAKKEINSTAAESQRRLDADVDRALAPR